MEPVRLSDPTSETSDAEFSGVDAKTHLNGIVPPSEIPNPDARVKKLKAKRLLKQSSKETVVVNGAGGGLVQGPRTWKNTRRPRNGYGRGLAKKGGAGGKGVWGKLGSELEDVDMDSNDPNYDSDSLDNPTVELKKIIPEEELRGEIESVIQEYLLHGDTEEALSCLIEVPLEPSKKHIVVEVAVEVALDHKPSHREMTSVLISDISWRLTSHADVTQAFESLLKNLPDLTLDTPDAATVVGNFIARAIADDCIPPKVIATYRELFDSPEAKAALTRADTLLSMKHGLVRLDNVWGVGGGIRPVKWLISQMSLLLREYLSSGDLKEATRCLLDLEVPHFHHELIYEAVLMVIEAINGPTEEAICRLLKSLSEAVIITNDMMEQGFTRIFDDMQDIVIDVPLAYSVLERFIERCQRAGFITEEILRRMPTRGRKRFVSEGDGGRIKEHL